MTKLDLRAQLKYLYSPSAKQVQVVDVPALNYLMIDGQIEPGAGPSNSPGFQQAMQAVYGVTYTLKFSSRLRKVDPVDYPVMALEGLWWVASGQFSFESKEPWLYTLLVVQPDHIDAAMFADAVRQVRAKRGDTPALSALRLERWEEGKCIQLMHVGPYSAEPEGIARMDAYAQEHGYTLHGKHHEIYMGDPRRAQPEKLKTILRHPVR